MEYKREYSEYENSLDSSNIHFFSYDFSVEIREEEPARQLTDWEKREIMFEAFRTTFRCPENPDGLEFI